LNGTACKLTDALSEPERAASAFTPVNVAASTEEFVLEAVLLESKERAAVEDCNARNNPPAS
jgi:hypothetical protein